MHNRDAQLIYGRKISLLTETIDGLKAELERLNELVQRYSTSEILMSTVRERDELKLLAENYRAKLANLYEGTKHFDGEACPWRKALDKARAALDEVSK